MNPANRPIRHTGPGRRLLSGLGLRSRILVAFVLFGLILSAGFAALAASSIDDFEAMIVRELLQGEMQEVIQARAADPTSPLPASRRMHVRVVPRAAVDTLPRVLASLRPGIHVLDEDSAHETVVDVQDAAAQRYFYIVELGDVAERERFVQWLLVAIVILGTLVSGGIGLLFASYLVSPVQRLARWVDASNPDHPGGALAAQFADDEVGALAVAFDRYQHRLEAFLRREREFTADASHELRSPLSVLQAGMDVVAEDETISPRGRRALDRMQRRAAELTDLLDALMYLARAESDPGGSVSPVPVLQTLRAALHALAATDPVAATQVDVSGDAEVAALAPPRMARLVFNRLLEHAVQHADGEQVRVTVAPGRVEIRPWSIPALQSDAAGQRRSDERAGLTLLTRLCLRLGWALDVAETDVLLLLFSDDKRPAALSS